MLAARLLVLLGALIGVIALISGYIRYQALDNETFRQTAGEMIEDDAIRDQIAAALVDQLFSNVDVTALLQERLPENQQAFAAPAAAALRELADRAAVRLLERPRAQELWVNSIDRAHEQLLRALHDEFAVVQTEEGFVVLNLGPLIDQLAERISLLGDVAARIPPDAGQIKIMEANKVETAQDLTNLFEKIAAVIWLVPFLLWALALWLARGRRRELLRMIALSAIVAALIILVLRRVAGAYVVGALTEDTPSVETAASHAWEILTDLLAQGALTLIGIAVIALVGVWLAGPSRWGTSARRGLAPYLARPEFAFGAAFVLLLLIVWWGPTPQTQRVPLVLTGAVLLAIGVEALRRVAASEPAAAPVGAGEASRLSLGLRRPAPQQAAPVEADRVAQLERLGSLREQGVLTQKEFAAEKARLLAGTPATGAPPEETKA
jgi:hypothetical protein